MVTSSGRDLGSESSTIGKPMTNASTSATAPTRRRRARFFSGSTGSTGVLGVPSAPARLADLRLRGRTTWESDSARE